MLFAGVCVLPRMRYLLLLPVRHIRSPVDGRHSRTGERKEMHCQRAEHATSVVVASKCQHQEASPPSLKAWGSTVVCWRPLETSVVFSPMLACLAPHHLFWRHSSKLD